MVLEITSLSDINSPAQRVSVTKPNHNFDFREVLFIIYIFYNKKKIRTGFYINYIEENPISLTKMTTYDVLFEKQGIDCLKWILLVKVCFSIK